MMLLAVAGENQSAPAPCTDRSAATSSGSILMLLLDKSHVFNLGMSQKTPLGTICKRKSRSTCLLSVWGQSGGVTAGVTSNCSHNTACRTFCCCTKQKAACTHLNCVVGEVQHLKIAHDHDLCQHTRRSAQALSSGGMGVKHDGLLAAAHTAVFTLTGTVVRPAWLLMKSFLVLSCFSAPASCSAVAGLG